jgi:hypothetical protein
VRERGSLENASFAPVLFINEDTMSDTALEPLRRRPGGPPSQLRGWLAGKRRMLLSSNRSMHPEANSQYP